MNHRILPAGLKEALIHQLVYFDENRHLLIDQLVLSSQWEKNEIKWLLQQYEQRIEKIVAGFVEDLLQSRILIGSRVLLQFEHEPVQESYKIVLPEEIDVDQNRISCLSPLGRGLLLAKCGDNVSIRTPEGDYFVTVVDNVYELTERPLSL